MTTSLHSRIVLARRVAAACGTGVLLVGAAGCGSSSPQPASAGTNSYGGSTGQQGATSGQFPGADGKVAAVTGSTAQVQSQQNGQVAVTWTSATAFTKQVTVKLSDVKVGDCVVATPAVSSSTSSTTPTAPATAITATSVRITAPVNGTCSPAGRFGTGTVRGGNGPGGSFGGQPPSGAEGGTGPQLNGGTGGTGRGQFRFGGFGAFGKVTALTSNGFTVTETRPGASGSTTAPTSVAVTTTSATTFSTTAKAAASDVKVGVCVRATGKTDDTGAITASTIAVTPPVNGVCGSFFRAGGPGGGFGGGAGGPALNSNGGQAS